MGNLGPICERYLALLRGCLGGAALIACLALPGCATTPAKNEDPLLGPKTPNDLPPPAPGGPRGTPAAFSGPPTVMPIPALTGGASTASLAGSRSLAIGDPSGQNSGWQRTNIGGATASFQGNSLPASAEPQPLPVVAPPDFAKVGAATTNFDKATGPSAIQPISAWAPGATAPSAADMQFQLRQRGIINDHADPVAEGVRFSCLAPNRNSNGGYRYYEVTAHDYASAVQAVLGQIDQNR